MQNRLATLQGYGTRIAELYGRIDDDKRPIDVAFIGSSHTVLAVNDKALEESLAASGERVNVANLGMYVIGRDLQLMLVKALLAAKQPRLIVVEIDEHETPRGHPNLPYVGTIADMLAPGLSLNLPENILLFLREQLLGVADEILPGAAPPPPVSRSAYLFRPEAGTWDGRAPDPLSIGDHIEKYFGPRARSIVTNALSRYGDSAVEQMVALAHAHDAAVMFLYLAEYKYAVDPDPALIAHYQRLAPVVVIPRSIAADVGNWFDPSHLNLGGSAKLTPTLSAAIGKALEPRSASAR
jgi:hypothetical protein